jgi:hypothetical protein
MREHDDCMTYETVAKEAPGGDSNSVSDQFLVIAIIEGKKKIQLFPNSTFQFLKYFHLSEDI